MTATVLNTKIGAVESKIPDVSGLGKKIFYDAKVSDIEKKYFTSSDYNKFTSGILDSKIKEKGLIDKFSISNLAKNSGLSTKLAILATKAELKAEQRKIKKLQKLDLSYFIYKKLFGDDGFYNISVYQPTLNTLELKEDQGTDCVIGWKPKGVYNSKFTPLHMTFLHNITLSEYKIGIQFNKSVLVVEQNNYVTKIINVYIASDSDDWAKILLNNFTLKSCLFDATNIVKNRDKSKYVYSGYGIALDGLGLVLVITLLGML